MSTVATCDQVPDIDTTQRSHVECTSDMCQISPDGDLDAAVQHLQQRLIDVVGIARDQRVQVSARGHEAHQQRTPALFLLLCLCP